jgi:hypothetical protein
MNRWKVTGLWSLIISTAFGLSLLIVLTEEARSYRLSSQQHPQQPTHWLRRTPVASSTQTKMSRFQHVFPSIIYGTAWKKERTKDLVELAVRTGFRAIDTACQPKHYNEAGVGDALETLYSDNFVRREELFLQTKFTSLQGQDPAQVPYDVVAIAETQITYTSLFVKGFKLVPNCQRFLHCLHGRMQNQRIHIRSSQIQETFVERLVDLICEWGLNVVGNLGWVLTL